MNDLLVLQSQSRNGFAIAVVAIPPGGNPYGPLYQWFEMNNFKDPQSAAERFDVVDRIENGAHCEGIVCVSEWYDNALVGSGRSAPKKTT